MNITRMYTGPDSKSYFEDKDLGFDPIQEAQRSANQSSNTIQFVYQPPGHIIDMHPAPRKQYVITLQGQAEIIMGDGTKRTFGPGDVVLAEDLTGEGHITKIIGAIPRISAQISVND